MTALRVDEVGKRFGATRVLEAVSLDVDTGELMAVLGPSGCGKTTLLRLIAGFISADSGRIVLGDELVSAPGRHVPAQARRVGYVAQEGALFPHLDVAGNITFGLSRRQRRGRARVAELLELVGLDLSYATRYPHQLSGGQQQRVAVARALAPKPSLVLLDEPFAALDANLRLGTSHAVADALRAAGATALLVTHDQSEALSLADRVAVMRDGRIVQVDTPQHVYQWPADPGVAEFVGGSVMLPALVADDVATCALGEVVLAAAVPSNGSTPRRTDVLVRPEQIDVAVSAGAGVAARVIDVSYFGHDADVRLRLVDDGQVVVARTGGASVPEPGALVHLAVRGMVVAFPGGDPSGPHPPAEAQQPGGRDVAAPLSQRR